MMVFVTGTQVSGIGLAARLLHELGFVFGDEVAAGSGAGVDFQRRDVARICERLLASAGASWDCPRLLTDAYWARAWAGPHDGLRQSAEQLVSSLGGRARVAVADVGLCLTLPFWRRIMRAPVPVVLCLRDPFELAEHLSATHGVSENFGLRLWETYLENAVLHTTAEQRIVLTYRELVDRPRRAASKLTARILSVSPRRSSGMASPAGPTTPEAVNALGSSTGEHWRRPRHARLRALYEQLSAEAEESREGLETTDLDMPARKLIVHYHLYKNAGTSVDRILERSFGRDRWVKYEGNGTHLTSDDMTRFVGLNPGVVAISSHVADIRPPTIRGVQVFPVVFLRHPLDRIASVYRFERRQQLDAPGPNRAKELDLRAYVEWRMTHDGVFRNFQTRRLARYSETSSPGDDSALVRALIAADRLPFIGIVEEFDRSIARLSVLLSPHFPELRCTAVNENVTQSPNLTLAQRLRGLRDALGDRLFEDVLRANQDDLVLYGAVRLTSDGS